MKRDFAEKKGSIGFGAENFFTNSINIRNEITSPLLTQNSTNVLHNMSFKVNMSYRIGKLTVDQRPSNRKGINNDDLKEGGDNGGGGGDTGAQGGGGGGARQGGGPPAGARPATTGPRTGTTRTNATDSTRTVPASPRQRCGSARWHRRARRHAGPHPRRRYAHRPPSGPGPRQRAGRHNSGRQLGDEAGSAGQNHGTDRHALTGHHVARRYHAGR